MLECEHLRALEADLISTGAKETFRGKAWSTTCREWVYFDCVLDVEKLFYMYSLPSFVITHCNCDPRSGLEIGLICTVCKDGVIGVHPSSSENKMLFRGI
jgi:hypothetical protein